MFFFFGGGGLKWRNVLGIKKMDGGCSTGQRGENVLDSFDRNIILCRYTVYCRRIGKIFKIFQKNQFLRVNSLLCVYIGTYILFIHG